MNTPVSRSTSIWLLTGPFLFTTFFYFHLVSMNLTQLENIGALTTPYCLSIVLTVVILCLLRRLTGSITKSCLITSAMVIFFFSYGHICELFHFRQKYLAPLYAVSFVVILLLVHRSRRDLTRLASNTSLLSLVLLSFPAVQISPLYRHTNDSTNVTQTVTDMPAGTRAGTSGSVTPDIYYIILDAYARNDVLLQNYDYDNSVFLDHLIECGFYVAPESNSNYANTMLSLSSSLNVQYHFDLAKRQGPETGDVSEPVRMIRNNKIASFLEKLGYKYVVMDSGWGPTSRREGAFAWAHFHERERGVGNPGKDDVIMGDTPLEVFFSEGETRLLLFNTTVLRAFPSFVTQLADRWRLRHLKNFRLLERIGKEPGPKFVVAHFMAPHPPFVFERDGTPTTPATLKLENPVGLPTAKFREGYLNQLIYLNKRITTIVDSIIAQSATPPIIIVQSDHGLHPDVPWRPNSEFCRQRFPVLNAYLVDDKTKALLYPSISPVNTFRVILHTYFGVEWQLLEDRSFFSPSGFKRTYDFTEVTTLLE